MAKYWSFSFSIIPFNEYSGLISFRIDWFDLLPVQGTLNSPLEHHNSKASFLEHSTFFMVQLSHLYISTGKTIALSMTFCYYIAFSPIIPFLLHLDLLLSIYLSVWFSFDFARHVQWFLVHLVHFLYTSLSKQILIQLCCLLRYTQSNISPDISLS